ncbi:MAG: hypothetical protein Ct9H300mP11_25020 [Chloroflexota bacterium]|nr:MAG: hypothetical protein Ct9H300mP11_25020 [Chloroflexota bacterium]
MLGLNLHLHSPYLAGPAQTWQHPDDGWCQPRKTRYFGNTGALHWRVLSPLPDLVLVPSSSTKTNESTVNSGHDSLNVGDMGGECGKRFRDTLLITYIGVNAVKYWEMSFIRRNVHASLSHHRQ